MTKPRRAMEAQSLELDPAEPLQEPLLRERQEQEANENTFESQQPPPSYSETLTSDLRGGRSGSRREIAGRILDRDAAFCQSRGRWRVQRVSREAARHHHLPEGGRRRLSIPKRLWDDWFYTLAYQRTIVLMMILFLFYTLIVFLFAFIYLGVSLLGESKKINDDGSTSTLPFCDMDIHSHMEALYFSLSTMTTIGYGVSDYYFGGCWTPLLLVLAQVCCAITFDAVAIGLLFQRISRGHKRAKTVLLSDKAVVRRVKGVPYLMFRIGELRSHQLLEATVRAYCIRHERHIVPALVPSNRPDEEDGVIETTHFVTRPVKLLHEELGSHILMGLPQVLVHRIDETSPLYPADEWYDAAGKIRKPRALPEASKGLDDDSHFRPEDAKEMEEIEHFLLDRDAEIIVLVEGTDELTGAAIQTRHSYTDQDLAWNRSFVPCVYPYSEQEEPEIGASRRRLSSPRFGASSAPVCVVDFARFHNTVQAPLDCNSCPYIIE